MSDQFVAPNWHVILIHYPLGLLIAGILIEVFSFLWRRSAVRTAGRWMILLGALSCIPAITVGVYAFRDIAAGGGVEEMNWHEVVQASPLSDAQWAYMVRHIWYASIGAALVIIAAVTWLASSNEWRDKLYYPLLAVLIIGAVAINVGAWYSGESIYRHGTAVGVAPMAKAAPAAETQEAIATQPLQVREGDENEPAAAGITYYIPPMQLHVLLAGLTVAIALGAFGVTVRRWTREPAIYSGLPHAAHVSAALDTAEEITRREAELARQATPEAAAAAPAPSTVPAPLLPARIWLAAVIAGVLTALGGLWMTGDWKLGALVEPLRDPAVRSEHQRLFAHILFGTSIVLLTGLAALLTRFARRQRAVTVICCVLLLLAVAGQLWLGILMLYDSDEGPLTGFMRAAAG